VNDFHGHLEPPEPDLGGAAWLAAHLGRAAGSHPGRTITVHAGDMVGASPLVSSHFHDEPAIEASNRGCGAAGRPRWLHRRDHRGDVRVAAARAPPSTVAVNGVLAAAERFTAFDRGWDRSVAGTDLEALVAWLSRRRSAARG
jgi:hypothetical protein